MADELKPLSKKPKIEVLPITQGATPDLNNVNRHTQKGGKLLGNSLRKRGANRSIASAGKGVEIPVVSAGNYTLENAVDAGFTEIVNVHVTGSQLVNVVRDDIAPGSPEFYALAIEDNEISKQSYSPDIDILAALAAGDSSILATLRAEDKIFDGMLEGMGLREEAQDTEPQIDRAAELLEKWGVITGDLWQIGEHRLVCGSSVDVDNWARLCGDELAQLTWTDPPYGVNYGEKLESANPISHRVRTIQNDDMTAEELEPFIRSVLTNCATHSVKGASIYVACPAGTPLPTLISSFVGSGYDFRWHLVWVKDQIVLSRADYHFKHENILYGWKGDGAHYFTDDRKQSSVFEYPRPKKSEEHPTMKPVELIMHMVTNSSKRGDVILEPFCGSGSTLIACQNLGRKGRGIEISPAYCAVTLERMSQAFPDLEIKRIL